MTNLPVGASISDEIENLSLADGQTTGHRVWLNRIPEPVKQLLGYCRIQQRLPAGDLPDAFHKAASTNLLEQISGGAGHHGGEERLVVTYEVRIRQRTLSCVERISRQTSMPLPSGSRASRSATSGGNGGNATQCIAGGRGLTNDDQIVGRRQELGKSSPNQFMIIKDEDSDSLVPGHRCSVIDHCSPSPFR